MRLLWRSAGPCWIGPAIKGKYSIQTIIYIISNTRMSKSFTHRLNS